MSTKTAEPTDLQGPLTERQAPHSLWSDSIRRLKKNKASVFSLYFIGFVCLMGVLAPWIAPYPFDLQDMDRLLGSPSTLHWLGTDSLGRDMLSRVIYGARVSMAVAISASTFSLIVGTIVGSVAGWLGGRMDRVIMRIIDIIYSIPQLVLLILVKVMFDALNIIEHPELKAVGGMFFALAAFGWASMARLVRGQVLQVREMLYIEAARALGVPGPLIILRHILPNILGPIIVALTFDIPANVLYESFLSFLGLGLQPPYSSWGVLANEGWRSLRTYPHLILFPAIAVFFTMLAFNLFGDGLRDAFDPKMKNR